MNSMTLSAKLLLLALTLPRSTSPCEKQDKPLLLSPFLDKNQVDKARLLSKVDKDCLEDFVPDSHTGFITVDKELGNHLFFWFFPSTEKDDAPLLLWLNGGPTVSSMLGLFWENGPMEVLRKSTTKNNCNDPTGYEDDGYIKRQSSWTDSFSMLYVDNPVGVGFSFSDSGKDGYRFTEEGYTKDMYSFLEQFFKLFPEYKNGAVYLGGQSYAGKYITALAYHIHNHNQLLPAQSGFNFTGIYLGAPWLDPESGYATFYDLLYALGIVSHQTLMEANMVSQKFYSQVKSGDLNVSELHQFQYDIYSYYRYDCYDNFVTGEMCGYGEVKFLMNKPEMKGAAHAGENKFQIYNTEYFDMFEKDSYLISVLPKLATLMDNYKVLIFNGDYDATVSTQTIEAALLITPWKFQGEYNATTRSQWRRDVESIGFYSLTDRFCRVIVHGGGHQLPRDKPEISLIMLQQFIKDGCVSDLPLVKTNTGSSLTPPFNALLCVRLILLLALYQACQPLYETVYFNP